jgi:hypothetical protein
MRDCASLQEFLRPLRWSLRAGLYVNPGRVNPAIWGVCREAALGSLKFANECAIPPAGVKQVDKSARE